VPRSLITATLLTVAALFGCGGDRPTPSADEPVALVPSDTLISAASELLGGVYDLAVAPNGDVYVADYGYKHVLAVSPDGAVRRTIGREGSGPGEFERPYVIRPGADSLWTFDAANNVVQVFDAAGALARSYRLEAPGLGAGRDFRDDGWHAATIGGFDNAMIAVFDGTGERMAEFGEPIVAPTNFYDFAAMKATIRDGRVPDAFRNRALLAWAPDHSLYVAFLAEPQVRRYDSRDSLVWTRTLDEPVLRSIFQTFVRKNVEEQNPSRIYALQYVSDLAVVGGDLWLLLDTRDEPDGLLLVLDAADGTVLRRITFPGLPNTGHIAADESRGRLYMAPQGDASVLVFDLRAARGLL